VIIVELSAEAPLVTKIEVQLCDCELKIRKRIIKLKIVFSFMQLSLHDQKFLNDVHTLPKVLNLRKDLFIFSPYCLTFRFKMDSTFSIFDVIRDFSPLR
jgi:hypothetical protein